MFDFSILKIFLTIMVGLIVLGPKRLAEIARTLGKYWRILQRTIDKAKSEFEGLVDEVDLKGTSKKQNTPTAIKATSTTEEVVDIQLAENRVTSSTALSKDYRDYDVKPKNSHSANDPLAEPESTEVEKEDPKSNKVLDPQKIN